MSKLKEVLSIIENQEKKSSQEQYQDIAKIMDEIFFAALKSQRGVGVSPDEAEIRASVFFRGYIGSAPGSPLIPFDLWEDLFLEGLGVLREFIETNETDYRRMSSFKAFCDKGEKRIAEWEKDPDLARLLSGRGEPGAR